MKWLVVALCLIQAAQLAIANGVPVFVWGDTAYKSAPVLSDQATDNLEDVLGRDNAATVIFVESQLSSDDFNYCSAKDKACFSYLGQQATKFYSPSIESPLPYLRTRVWGGAVKTVHADDQFSVAAGETLFVHFRDGAAYATHNERLASHDAQIERIVRRLGDDQDIVFVYTAIEDHATHKRVARQAKQTTETPEAGHQTRGEKFVFRVLQIATMNEGQRNNLTISGDVTLVSEAGSNAAKLTVPTSPPVEMDMRQEGGAWWVETLSHDGKHYTSGVRIGANMGFSFACSPEVVYQSPNSTNVRLMLQGLQLELNLDREASDTKMAFSDSYNCVGFTSAGIWGGMFVTLLLLAILTIGISWMLDINTMDRFDDPKGKTITINAQE